MPEVGGSFTDSGSGTCHSARPQRSVGARRSAATRPTARCTWPGRRPSDGGAPITGYKIYRGTTAGGETLLRASATSPPTTTTPSPTARSTTTGSPAVNSVGEGAQSNEVSATPRRRRRLRRRSRRTAAARRLRPAAGALGPNWQSPGLADPGTVAIASSGLTESASGAASATWNAGTFGADQEAYLTVPTLPAAGRLHPGRRAGQHAQRRERLLLLPAGDAVDRAPGTCARSSTAPPRRRCRPSRLRSRPATAIGLQVVGSTLTAYRKPGAGAWTAVGSATDTAIPAGGYVSFTLGDTTMRGGALRRAAASPAPPSAPAAPVAVGHRRRRRRAPSWTAPSDGGAPITGYNIYRGTAAGGETLLTSVGNVTSYDDNTAVANGTTYYYRVAAVNSVGEGAQSNEVSATPIRRRPARPAAPTLSATAGDASVHLSWNAPADGGAAITGYNLYRGTAAGGETLLSERRQRDHLRRHAPSRRHHLLLPRRRGQQRRRGHAVERGRRRRRPRRPAAAAVPAHTGARRLRAPRGRTRLELAVAGARGRRHGHDRRAAADQEQRRGSLGDLERAAPSPPTRRPI